MLKHLSPSGSTVLRPVPDVGGKMLTTGSPSSKYAFIFFLFRPSPFIGHGKHLEIRFA